MQALPPRLVPLALSIALVFSTSNLLSGCERLANYSAEEYVQRAKDMQNQGNLKGSIIELKNAVQKDPNNAQARWLLGQAYIRFKLGDSALKELEKARELGVGESALRPHIGQALLLKRDYKRILDDLQVRPESPAPERAQILQLRADALMGMGKAKEACDLYRGSSLIDPKLARAYVGQGLCAFSEGRPEEAEKLIKQAIQLDSRDPDNWLALASFEQTQDKTAEAKSAYDNALKAEHTNLDALSGRATILLTMNQVEAAQKDIDTLHRLYPKHHVSKYMEALQAFRSQQYDKSRDLLEGNLKAAPNHVESLFLLGATYQQLSQYSQAAQKLNDALRIAPNSIPIRTLLASIQLKLNQPKAALDNLNPIVQLPQAGAPQLGLAGEALLMLGKTREALALFERAQAIAPQSSAAKQARGRAQLALGNLDAGIEALQEASKQKIGSQQTDLIMAQALWQKGQSQDALEILLAAESRSPNDVRLPQLRGNLLFNSGDLQGARGAFEKVLAIEPTNTPIIIALADLDERQGKSVEAQKRLTTALGKAPKDESLLLAMAYLSKKRGDFAAERKWIEKAASANPDAIQPQELLVRMELAAGNTAKALNLAQNIASRQSDQLAAQLLLANTQMAAGDFLNAASVYKKILSSQPKNVDVLYRLGLAQIGLNKPDDARRSLNAVISASTDASAPLAALASLEIKDKKYGQAVDLARRLQQQDPQNPAGLILEGDSYYAMARYAQALALYERAYAILPQGSLVLKSAQAMERSGQKKQAEKKLADWVSAHPDDNDTRQALAERLEVSGRTSEAIKHYEYLLKASPSNILVLNNLANLYLNQNDPRAMELANRAKKLAPESAAVLDTYGWIMVINGRHNDGKAALEKAAQLAPSVLTLRYHLAVALAKSGETNRARRELTQLLSDKKAFPDRSKAEALLKSL